MSSADLISSSASVNLIGMRCEPLSRLSDVIRKDRFFGLTCSLFAQSMFNQPRHVVYHSHYPCIFYSHRANDAESAHVIAGSDSIRRSDQSTVAHRSRRMLASDHDVDVARIARRIVNTLIQYLDQARLLFK